MKEFLDLFANQLLDVTFECDEFRLRSRGWASGTSINSLTDPG
jgi:hypothetical protein